MKPESTTITSRILAAPGNAPAGSSGRVLAYSGMLACVPLSWGASAMARASSRPV